MTKNRYIKQPGSAERYLDTETGKTISKRQYLTRQRGGITVEKYAKQRKKIRSYQKSNEKGKKRKITQKDVISSISTENRKTAWWNVIIAESDSQIFIDNGMNPKDANNPKKRIEFYKKQSEVTQIEINNRARSEYETNEDYEKKRAIRKEEEEKERIERMRQREIRMNRNKKL